jgi:hypothetical protein
MMIMMIMTMMMPLFKDAVSNLVHVASDGRDGSAQ